MLRFISIFPPSEEPKGNDGHEWMCVIDKVSWFNPNWQLNTTQLLTHSPLLMVVPRDGMKERS